MNKTDEILDRLKDWQPTLDNPDELTDRIMDSLSQPLQRRGQSRRQFTHPLEGTGEVLRALQYISSIAAVLLVGLFLYVHVPTGTATKNEAPHYYTSHLSAGSTLKDVYTHRQQQAGLITYNQLRKKLYENK